MAPERNSKEAGLTVKMYDSEEYECIKACKVQEMENIRRLLGQDQIR